MLSKFLKNSFSKYSFFMVAIILLFSSVQELKAHAGTTINYRVFFKFDGIKVIGVGESWSFDDMTSNMLMTKYKLEKDKKLNKKESIEVGKKLMEDLEGLRYFTYISVDGKDLGELKVSGFKAQVKGEILSVAFNNPLPKAVDVSKHSLSVEVKDVDATIETKLVEKKPIVLIGMDEKNCKIDITETLFTGGFFSADELFSMNIVPPKKIKLKCENLPK